MPLLFKAKWNQVSPRFADRPDVRMTAELDNSEDNIRAIIFEAWYAGGFSTAMIAAMLTQANAEGGAHVVVREGLHQVEDQGEHGDGFNLHIGTQYNGVNFHLNVHQNARGRLYVSSISFGNNADRQAEVRPNQPPG